MGYVQGALTLGALTLLLSLSQTLTEGPQCAYTIQATTSLACSTKGDPFISPNLGPQNFGFTLLGWFVCAPVSYFLYLYLDNKGYLDPIKSRLPALPFSLDFVSGRGGVYGSGSYKGVSASSGGATSTPISASAYGST